MKYRMKAIILAAGLAVILTACGSSDAGNSENKDEAATQSTAESNADSAESATEDGSKSETAADAAETAADSVEETDGMKVEDYGLVNNGGHFVKYGDIVYFHAPDEAGLEATGLFGEYIDTESGTTQLMAFHTDTKKTEKVLDDHSYNGIYIAGSKMYLDQFAYDNENPTDEYCVYDIPGGFSATEFKGEMVHAAAEDGSAVVTGIFDGDHNGYILKVHMQDGKEYTTDDNDILHCIACDKDRLFYTTYNYNDKSFTLGEFDYADGKSISLGSLPAPTYSDAQEGPGELKEVILQDGGIYFSVNYYEGTGHFLSQSFVVSAEAGKADSVTYEEEGMVDEEEGVEPVFMVRDGKPDTSVDGAPSTAAINSKGELVYYDENGKEQKAANTGTSYEMTVDDDGNIKSMTECVEYIEGTIYGIKNELERVPEQDIGWRLSYKRTKSTVFAVDTATGEETELYSVSSK